MKEAEAALAGVDQMVWGFPLTIEVPRPATKPQDSPYAEDNEGLRTHAMLDRIARSVLALKP